MASPSLNANNKPSWIARRLRGIAANFYPELHEQEQGGPAMTRYGVVKSVMTKSGRAHSANKRQWQPVHHRAPIGN